MNVLIHIDRLCLHGVDERVAREVLARLEIELRERAASAGWRDARVAVLRANVRGAHPAQPAQLARALADALLGCPS
ncbi:hypothetical protein CR51_41460 [Caballeronia megalochromosomata]|jgi:hypothetical protein|nr:hypothetical protein CR51_41460 [Caballeronia megalochromosomata]